MKIKLVILFTLFAQVSSTYAQEDKQSQISLSFGPAFAIGKFADTDLFNSSSGFAKTGGTVSLAYLHTVSKNWKLLVNLSGQRNPINTNAFETILATTKISQGFGFGSVPNNPSPQTNYAVYPNWHFDKKSWLLGSLQIGTQKQFSIPGQSKFSPTIKATVGAVFASSPHLKGSSVTDTASAFIEQSKRSGIGFIYTIGAGVHYSLNNKMYLFTCLDYCGTSDIKYKDIKSILTTTKGAAGSPGYSIQQAVTTANGSQTMSSVNLSVGICFVL